ncbi:type II toxin-antitoxin system Phd/YefM family antitoxin [Sphingomonas sp. DC2300-3]|uniref:type II toxin-antitoxin system Phd/YefM family antitoxin n=1 Tax=unclassified Sphingomonas TaxID=196159 RepID=UPI003CED8AEC
MMGFAERVKPISYVKAHAADVLTELTASREPLAITQNGEVKAVLQDVASYDETRETLALLKLLALGTIDIEHGDTRALEDVAAAIRAG